MSGVKANIASRSHPADVVGKPAANAGQGEPSIDDILASIRQIISDQNRQADFAAEKAAAEVANKAPAAAKVESIIGTVAADHWKDGANAAAVAPKPARASRNPSELEELIQLIGATPPAPRPTQQAMWIDPNSKATAGMAAKNPVKNPAQAKSQTAVELNSGPAQPVRFDAPVKKINSGPGATKSAVILPSSPSNLGQKPGQNPSPYLAAKPAAKPEPRLHPSVLPKTVVPQVIKEAIARPLAKTVAAGSQPPVSQASPAQRSDDSHKSALDRLIARKAGMDAGQNPAAKAPVQQIVEPRAAAPIPSPQQISQQAAPAAAQMPVESARSGVAPIAKTADPVRKAAGNSPAISSQAVNTAVVKSIERLASSMFSDRKEEIDGMMAGIVRPMLQDWLEDNLPSLVERIVREEIERVSRGTHR